MYTTKHRETESYNFKAGSVYAYLLFLSWEQNPLGRGRQGVPGPLLVIMAQSFLSGEALRLEMNKETLGHEPLIEDFLFKRTTTAIVAPPGVGKSVITANISASVSCGLPVFGLLQCQPIKIAYLQMEGDRDEQLSRLKAMESVIPFNLDNIGWFTPWIVAEKEETWADLFIELDQFKPFDLIIIDPIYKLTMYGLSAEKSVLAVIKLLDKMKSLYDCAIIINHHTTKETYDAMGEAIKKDDPFYGSQWIKANLDASFLVKKLEDNRIELQCKKSRASNLISNIVLDFDISNFTLSTVSNHSSMPARLRILKYLNSHLDLGPIRQADMCRKTGISVRHLRRLKADGIFDSIAIVQETKGKDSIWLKK